MRACQPNNNKQRRRYNVFATLRGYCLYVSSVQVSYNTHLWCVVLQDNSNNGNDILTLKLNSTTTKRSMTFVLVSRSACQVEFPIHLIVANVAFFFRVVFSASFFFCVCDFIVVAVSHIVVNFYWFCCLSCERSWQGTRMKRKEAKKNTYCIFFLFCYFCLFCFWWIKGG